MQGTRTTLCRSQCGWTSNYAYAYAKELQRANLYPDDLQRTSISSAILDTESMPDPEPLERNDECIDAHVHEFLHYRKDRTRQVNDLIGIVGLCLHCVRSGFWEPGSNCKEYLNG